MGPAGQLGKIIATFLPEPAPASGRPRIDYQVGPRPSVKPFQNQAQGLDAPVGEGRSPACAVKRPDLPVGVGVRTHVHVGRPGPSDGARIILM
jgi:hypothetical protein